MSATHLHNVVGQYRATLRQSEAATEHTLNTAHAQMVEAVQPRLQALYREIEAKRAMSEDGDVPLHWLYEQNRLASIKQRVENGVSAFAALALMTVVQSQHNAAMLGVQSARAQLHRATSATAAPQSFVAPAPQPIKPIDHLFHGMGAEAAQIVGSALLLGISLKHTISRIRSHILQALGVSRWRSLTINRTETMNEYRDNLQGALQENADEGNGWIWVAFPGACAFCTEMDGTKHSWDEDMQSHVNCRCQMVPDTDDSMDN